MMEQRIPAVQRTLLVSGAFTKQLDRIEAYRVILEPRQASGRHVHPGGVCGYVESGNAILCVEGETAQRLASGDVFYEPPGRAIERFDNASDTETLVFVAWYPLYGDMPLLQSCSEDER